VSNTVNTNVETYVAVLWSYVYGSIRLNEAELATHRFSISVAKYKAQVGTTSEQTAIPEFLYQFDRMSYREWDAFQYVTALSYLVYATSLLDTFLNDTTKFLLLMHPGAIGKEVKLTTEEILSAKHPLDLIGLAVARKAREISFGSFVQRLSFLHDRFSIKVGLSPEFQEQLEHYSTVRNVVVHDQGFLELRASESGFIEFTQKACPRHPTLVDISDLRKAYKAYAEVMRQVGRAVLHDVLQVRDHKSGEAALSALSNSVAEVADEEPKNA
jgi:hypothetical protein